MVLDGVRGKREKAGKDEPLQNTAKAPERSEGLRIWIGGRVGIRVKINTTLQNRAKAPRRGLGLWCRGKEEQGRGWPTPEGEYVKLSQGQPPPPCF